MIIPIRVIPRAKKAQIRKETDLYRVYTPAPAVDGKANKALISQLAAYFGVKNRQIQIIKGLKSRDKTIKIEGL